MTDLTANLMALATGSQRPLVHRLADLRPAIEHALAAGSSRAQVVRALNAGGLAITLRQLDNALYRLRRRARSGARPDVGPAPVCVSAAVVAPPALPTGPPSSFGATDPRRIDAIRRTPPDLAALARLSRQLKSSP